MDTTRELRSMQMVLFACPPIPILCVQNSTHDCFISNSHDLLSMLIDVAMRRNVSSENIARMTQQADIEERFQQVKPETLTNMDAISSILIDVTRSWMLTYSHAVHDLQFLPLERATPKILAQVRAWLASQHVLLDEITSVHHFNNLSIFDLYSLCIFTKLRVLKQEKTEPT